LNQTDEEKEIGVMRLNWIVLRENAFNSKHCLWVGQCLALGRAFYCASLETVNSTTADIDTEG
jgi:hypothetical protein